MNEPTRGNVNGTVIVTEVKHFFAAEDVVGCYDTKRDVESNKNHKHAAENENGRNRLLVDKRMVHRFRSLQLHNSHSECKSIVHFQYNKGHAENIRIF